MWLEGLVTRFRREGTPVESGAEGKGAGQTRSPVSDSSTQWDRTATLLHSMWSKFDKGGECDTICNDAFN